MRKLNLFLLMTIFLGAATIFTGCNKDEDDPITGSPSIDFKGGANYTFENVTVTTNDQIVVGILAAMHSETEKPLTNFKLTIGTSVPVDSTFNANSFDADYTINFNEVEVGVYTLTAKITDESGSYDEISFEITVEQGGVNVTKNTNIEMGSFNDPEGSFYSTGNATVYTVAQAKLNQAAVDFIFFKGVTYFNAIAAPDDAIVNTISDFQLNDWTVKNQTKFNATTMTAAEFDAIGSTYVFPEFNTTTAASLTYNLVDGQVVYFKTQAGKHGYIKVVDLYSRGDMAKFDVIIEQ
jgi:hypothetical protein